MTQPARTAAHATRVALAALLAWTPACILLPVPTPEHGHVAGTGVIPEEQTRTLEIGKTRRTEVLLHFGQPAASRCEDRVLVYHWAVAHGWVLFVIGGPGGGAGAVFPIPKSYLLLLTFDEQGRLLRVERIEDLFTSAPEIAKLMPEDCLAAARGAEAEPRTPSFRELQRWHGYVASALVEPALAPASAATALSSVPPLRVWIQPFSDARDPELGELRLAKPSFDAGVVGLWTYRRVVDVVRAVVADAWRASAHVPTPVEPDVVVEGRVERIAMDLDWDWRQMERVATVEVSLRARPTEAPGAAVERRYAASARVPVLRRTDDMDEWEQALGQALTGLARQVGEDEALARLLRDARRASEPAAGPSGRWTDATP